MTADRIIELIFIAVGVVTVFNLIVFAIMRIWSKILDQDAVLAKLRQKVELVETIDMWAELELYELLDKIKKEKQNG